MMENKYNIQYHISLGKTRLPQVQVENQMHMEITVPRRQRLGRRLLTRNVAPNEWTKVKFSTTEGWNTKGWIGALIAIITWLNACCTMRCISSWTSSTQRRLGSSSLRICLLTKSSNEISGTNKAGRGPYNTKKQKSISYRAHPTCGHTQMALTTKEMGDISRSCNNESISWVASVFFVLYSKFRKFSNLAPWLIDSARDTSSLFPKPTTKARQIPIRGRGMFKNVFSARMSSTHKSELITPRTSV